MLKTGAEHLVHALMANGTTHVFCVPGESYLAVLDALVGASITVITCRHEAAAANMAAAHGKLTGRAGICFVTRGPGATHASIGVHTAFQDSVPMLLFIGQVARADRDREAFQEVNYRAMFAPLAKDATEIDDAARVPEYINRAFATAENGRPGPVVISLPEDMLTDVVEACALPASPRLRMAPAAADIEHLSALLKDAASPMLVVGGTGWTEQAAVDITAFAVANGLPIVTSFRAKDIIDNRHSHYAGDMGIGPNPKLAARITAADLLIVVGARLGEMTTGSYTLLPSPVTKQKLVHIHVSAEELGRVYYPTVAMCATMPEAAFALSGVAVRAAALPVAERAAYLEWIRPTPDGLGLNLSTIFSYLDQALPEDAIVCNGAGNYAVWTHRFCQHKKLGTQLAPTSGAMGYGVPAAIAAKIMQPEKMVVSVAGDGCFMMSMPDLATAVRYKAAVIFIVVNNSQYGTIRMHQEKHYPGRQSATALTNPDFVALAKAFGMNSWKVERAEDFAAVFAMAQTDGGPTLIEIITNPDDIAPGRTLS